MKITLSCVSSFSEARDKFSPERSKQNEDSLIVPLKKVMAFYLGLLMV